VLEEAYIDECWCDNLAVQLLRELVLLNFIIIIILFDSLIALAVANVRRVSLNEIKEWVLSHDKILWLVIISLTFSIFRALFVDPPIVVSDGYDHYAIFIQNQITDWGYNLDAQYKAAGSPLAGWPHTLRIGYSLVVGIISLIPGADIIMIGRVISFICFLSSIYLLDKILTKAGYLQETWKRTAVIFLYISNVTIVTNMVRFGTDFFFLALLMLDVLIYMNFIQKQGKKRIPYLILLIMLSILLLFTREVGAIFIGAMLLHQFLTTSKRSRIAVIVLGVIGVFFIYLSGFLTTLLFHLIWTATTHQIAVEIVYNGNIAILGYTALGKFLSVYNLTKTIEALIYAFGVAALAIFLSAFRVLSKSNLRRKILAHLLSIYFLLFTILYGLLKISRGLDRFFIPILFIPLLLVPHGITVLADDKRNPIFNKMSVNFSREKTVQWMIIMQYGLFWIRTMLSLFGFQI
jgi:hypothetical protein